MNGPQKIAVIYFPIVNTPSRKTGYTAQFDLCDTGAWVQIPYRPEYFSGLIITTAPVVHITERITFIHVFIHSSNI